MLLRERWKIKNRLTLGHCPNLLTPQPPRHGHYNKMAYDKFYSLLLACSQMCLILLYTNYEAALLVLNLEGLDTIDYNPKKLNRIRNI